MVEMAHGRMAAGDTAVVSTAAVLRCGKQWKNYHISTFPGQSLSKNRGNVQDASAGDKTFLR
jgi:hypothetical protein